MLNSKCIKYFNPVFSNSYLYALDFTTNNLFYSFVQDKITDVTVPDVLPNYQLDHFNWFSLMSDFTICFSVSLNNLNTFENRRILAASLLIKYITGGGHPFICNFSSFKTFTSSWCALVVSITFRREVAYNFLEYYITTLWYLIPTSALSTRFIVDRGYPLISIHTLTDFNFYRMTVFHSVFLNWSDKLEINFFFGAPTARVDLFFFYFFRTLKPLKWEQGYLFLY